MNIQAQINILRTRLRTCQATNAALSEAAAGELSPSWISKFRSGHLHNPRVDTLVALDRALNACEGARSTEPERAAA